MGSSQVYQPPHVLPPSLPTLTGLGQPNPETPTPLPSHCVLCCPVPAWQLPVKARLSPSWSLEKEGTQAWQGRLGGKEPGLREGRERRQVSSLLSEQWCTPAQSRGAAHGDSYVRLPWKLGDALSLSHPHVPPSAESRQPGLSGLPAATVPCLTDPELTLHGPPLNLHPCYARLLGRCPETGQESQLWMEVTSLLPSKPTESSDLRSPDLSFPDTTT